ncbi:MAG: hypothetical protein H7293_14430 [Candidatus Saccharibacteria bacterium]|nr:hypothetical protein [Rhodoferax sp.]
MSQQPRHGEDSNDKPDALRDARLAQALKHMPDAHLQPDPQARSAVLQAALRALDSAPATAQNAHRMEGSLKLNASTSAWQKGWFWLLGQPGQRMPLTGALASLLVASMVTLMWYDQDVPDANPQSAPVAVANHGGAPDKAESASPSSTTAQKAAEPPQTSAAPQTRTVPPLAPAPTQTPTAPAAPPAQGATPSPPAVVAPGAVDPTQAADNVPAPLPAPAKESSAERNDTRPASTPMAEKADSAKPTAKMAAAAPAPMAHSANRARQEAIASPGLQVVLDGQRRSLTPAQSASLLAALRALPWQGESSRADAANAIGGLMADSATALTVQTPDGERWDISATSVRATTAGIVSTSPLTTAQWLQLRALATPAAP